MGAFKLAGAGIEKEEVPKKAKDFIYDFYKDQGDTEE
jgi:hypothetical protein